MFHASLHLKDAKTKVFINESWTDNGWNEDGYMCLSIESEKSKLLVFDYIAGENLKEIYHTLKDYYEVNKEGK
jgi:hypothetical protein